jgi:predicted nuclease with RNAse H fold
MKVLGIDLSGPRNIAGTCLVCFDERGDELHLIDVCEGADDDQILKAITRLDPGERIAIGIDAPLSYNANGGDRPSDRELRHLILDRGARVGIMPPTMIRMVYLTLRGVVLTRLFESQSPEHKLEIVEVHPGASMILRGADMEQVRTFKFEPSARQNLLNWLETKGLQGISSVVDPSDHYVAACAAALAAWQWAIGKSIWRSAKAPPHHPYDFAC